MGKAAYTNDRLVTEVHALYDFALPAVTVELWWIPMRIAKLNSKKTVAYLRKHIRHEVRAFSLTTKVRLSGSEPGCWWETIRRWILEEGGRLGWDFHTNVAWVEVDGPNTREHATTRAFTDDELTAMHEGRFTWQPTYSILDLRNSYKPVYPRRQLVTDYTPLKFREEVLCACGTVHGSHTLFCQSHEQWLRDKAKWLEWYRRNMGGEPVLQPGSVDQARILRETFL